jgi:hypothetical protein
MYNSVCCQKEDREMTDIGGVGFEIRLSELRKAQKHLLFNRGAFKETDCADLLVSPCVATFRTVGTEFEAPVKGSRLGPARMPLKTLKQLVQAAATFGKPEIKLHFEPGKVQVENKFIIRHPDVSLGIFPSQKFDLPPDAGLLDTLALASLLLPEQIADQVCASASRRLNGTHRKRCPEQLSP